MLPNVAEYEPAGEGLLSRALTLTSRHPGLADAHRQLEALAHQAADDTIRLAVVGLSSGGKSSFLNAVMGEGLLPEATGATTNVLTRCRKGPQRRLAVHFLDGTQKVYAGLGLNAEAIAAWCAEALNPDNSKGVAYMEWSTPLAALPDGMVLIDTPGFDAFGHEALETVTLDTCLPAADGVLYVAPIRHPFTAADLRLLDSLLTYDQRTAFVLTQADRETDTYQGGRIWCTREEKLAGHLARLESVLAAYPKLRRSGVLTVSTRWAQDGAGDATSEAWQASGFAEVLTLLDSWKAELGAVLDSERRHRLATHLGTLAQRLAPLEDHPFTPAPMPDGGIAAAVAALEARWRDRLDPDTRLAAFEQGLTGLADDAAVLAFGRERRAEWEQGQATMLAEMSDLQRQGRAALEAAGLDSSQWAAVKSFHVGAYFPESAPFLRRAERSASGAWTWDFLAWRKSEQAPVLDRDGYLAALEAFVGKTSKELSHYLGWWVATMTAAILEPLAAQNAPVVPESDLQRELAGLLAEARAVLGQAPAVVSTLPMSPEMRSERHVQAAGALQSLIAIFREAGFQRAFARFLADLAPEPPRRVLLLGAQRDRSLRLAALLGHDLARWDVWRQAPEGAWLSSDGSGTSPLCVPDTLLARLELVVAPADDHLPPTDWPAFLQSFDAIGVELEAARLACSWSTLARAPYAEALAGMSERVFYTCGDGGLFGGHRLAELAELAEPGPCGARAWFIYEDYDARYTDFLRLLRELSFGEGSARELVRRWRLAELPEDAPFTEADLRRAAQDVHHVRWLRRAP